MVNRDLVLRSLTSSKAPCDLGNVASLSCPFILHDCGLSGASEKKKVGASRNWRGLAT